MSYSAWKLTAPLEPKLFERRRPGTLLFYRGKRAVVRFYDGATVAFPAPPFRDLKLARGSALRIVELREHDGSPRGKVVDVRVEVIPGRAHHKKARMATPHVQLRRGRAVITRR